MGVLQHAKVEAALKESQMQEEEGAEQRRVARLRREAEESRQTVARLNRMRTSRRLLSQEQSQSLDAATAEEVATSCAEQCGKDGLVLVWPFKCLKDCMAKRIGKLKPVADHSEPALVKQKSDLSQANSKLKIELAGLKSDLAAAKAELGESNHDKAAKSSDKKVDLGESNLPARSSKMTHDKTTKANDEKVDLGESNLPARSSKMTHDKTTKANDEVVDLGESKTVEKTAMKRNQHKTQSSTGHWEQAQLDNLVMLNAMKKVRMGLSADQADSNLKKMLAAGPRHADAEKEEDNKFSSFVSAKTDSEQQQTYARAELARQALSKTLDTLIKTHKTNSKPLTQKQTPQKQSKQQQRAAHIAHHKLQLKKDKQQASLMPITRLKILEHCSGKCGGVPGDCMFGCMQKLAKENKRRAKEQRKIYLKSIGALDLA